LIQPPGRLIITANHGEPGVLSIKLETPIMRFEIFIPKHASHDMTLQFTGGACKSIIIN